MVRVQIKGLPANYVLSNLVYLNDTLWGAHSNGVFALDIRSGASQFWPMPDNMNKQVYDFANDKAGNIWIASKSGLLVFNRHTRRFMRYGEGDGLVSGDMNGSLGLMRDGKMIFGADNYFTVFDPKSPVAGTAARHTLP